MPALVGMLIGAVISPLLLFASTLFIVAIVAKAFALGSGAPLSLVCIIIAMMLTVWNLRIPIRDVMRARKGQPRLAYSGQYSRALRKALVGITVTYLVYLAARHLPS